MKKENNKVVKNLLENDKYMEGFFNSEEHIGKKKSVLENDKSLTSSFNLEVYIHRRRSILLEMAVLNAELKNLQVGIKIRKTELVSLDNYLKNCGADSLNPKKRRYV